MGCRSSATTSPQSPRSARPADPGLVLYELPPSHRSSLRPLHRQPISAEDAGEWTNSKVANARVRASSGAARLLSLARAKGFDTWEAACEADRVKWEAAQQAEEAEAKRKQAEVEAILDRGPDPDLAPASEPVVASSEAFHVATFEKAIDMLRSVETKPASMFGSAKISPNDIEQITAFLREVAKQIAESRRAA
jgi:hypothetical protein